MAKVGVLALQGDYEKHARALERAGAHVAEVRTAEELDGVDGLVIPGGESTTMLKLLDRESLMEPLREFGAKKPIFGTCAGAILLAKEVENPSQPSLELVDIAVQRNAYGRQLDSRVAHVDADGFGPMEAVFIRAPIIRKTGPGVKVLARYNGDPVLVEQGRHLVATFHPELSSDDRVHAYFLQKVTG
ncbi:MAG: pyridoxal 5'-phosphate synthase glutaminase subunit PdxT [Acidobacteria bacterium]|nr:pyridoxal 5'-phosphate synthase glutaminase subunit PdxT [Acidobacteriota bacterium]